MFEEFPKLFLERILIHIISCNPTLTLWGRLSAFCRKLGFKEVK